MFKSLFFRLQPGGNTGNKCIMEKLGKKLFSIDPNQTVLNRCITNNRTIAYIIFQDQQGHIVDTWIPVSMDWVWSGHIDPVTEIIVIPGRVPTRLVCELNGKRYCSIGWRCNKLRDRLNERNFADRDNLRFCCAGTNNRICSAVIIS